MRNQDKAYIYDELIRESDALQRVNSKLKSEYVTNIPPHVADIIQKNNIKIAELVSKLEGLFNG